MHSELKFYQVDFKQDDNIYIDENFNEYLSNCYLAMIDDFQYIRNAKELQIKINKQQTELEKPLTTIGNYIAIQNIDDDEETQTTIIFYYFITKQTQISQNTIELSLMLDLLHTFPPNEFYDFSERTIIQREHIDRYTGVAYRPVGGLPLYVRKINAIHEDNPVEFYKDVESEQEIHDNDNANWFLMYVSQNNITETSQNIPVDIYCVSDNDNLYAQSQDLEDYKVNPIEWQSGSAPFKNYVFGTSEEFSHTTTHPLRSGKIKWTKENDEIATYTINPDTDKLLIIRIDYQSTWGTGAVFRLLRERENQTAESIVIGDRLKINTQIAFETDESAPQFIVADTVTTGQGAYPYNASIANKANWVINNAQDVVTLTRAPAEVIKLATFKTIARTDTRLLKIIKLPYANFNYTITRQDTKDIIELPDNMTVNSILWQGQEISQFYLKVKSDFDGLFVKDIQTNIKAYKDLFYAYDYTTDDRDDESESKLYMSDYQYNKFYYDTFSKIFKNENIKVRTTQTQEEPRIKPDTTLNLKFITSSAMQSRFLFDFHDLSKGRTEHDFDDIVAVARNNEIQLYNSSYLNYIRSGYNYDVKNKNLAYGASLLGLGVGTASSLLSGNYIGAGLSGAIGIANLMTSISQNENNIDAKLNALKNQAVNVDFADDIDLLTYYANNRARFCKYKISDERMKQIADKFYFYGYLTNRIGAPVLKTRKSFNYIQCLAKLINVDSAVTNYINDIITLWQNGVTVMHNKATPTAPAYDFAQTSKNMELIII